jgi:hypothetical protein
LANQQTFYDQNIVLNFPFAKFFYKFIDLIICQENEDQAKTTTTSAFMKERELGSSHALNTNASILAIRVNHPDVDASFCDEDCIRSAITGPDGLGAMVSESSSGLLIFNEGLRTSIRLSSCIGFR